MSQYKLFGQRIGLIGITNLLLSPSGLILIPILTKNLPVEEYGVWIQVMVLIGFISPVAQLGLSGSLVRFIAAEKEKRKIQEGFYSIAVFILLTNLIASFLLFLYSKTFAEVFLEGRVDLIKIILLIIPIVSLNSLSQTFFQAFQEIKKYSLIILLQNYIMLVLVAYSVLSGYGTFWALMSYLIAQIIVFFLTSFLIFTRIGIKIPDFSQIKQYLKFGLPAIPSVISSWVITLSDRYLISYFLGAAFVGYYAPAYGIGETIMLFVGPVSFLLFPTLSKLYDEDKIHEAKMHLKYALKYFMLLAIPSAFGLSLLSKEILIILSTPEIAAQGYMITPFIALSILFYGAYSIVGFSLVMVKKPELASMIWIIAAIVNFGLNLVFIPFLGIIGASMTKLITYALAYGLITYYSFKYIRFDIDVKFILKSIFASLVMSLVIISWDPKGKFSVLLVIGICIVVYGVIIWILKGIKKDEIEFFKKILSR